MNSVGNFIRAIRREKGLSLRQLAARCGLSHSYLDSLEKGIDPRSNKPVSPTLETLGRLAGGLGMTLGEFLYLAGIINESDIKPYGALQEDSGGYLAAHTVPLLGKVRVGMPLLTGENCEGDLQIPGDIQADFAFRVWNQSMVGLGIHEGDYAICRRTEVANPGDIVVVLKKVDERYCEANLKYFTMLGNRPVLRAAHPSYAAIHSNDDYCICGVVSALLKKQPPPYTYYTEWLSTCCDYALEWSEVIEEAVHYGIKPEIIRLLIANQVEIAQKMLEER